MPPLVQSHSEVTKSTVPRPRAVPALANVAARTPRIVDAASTASRSAYGSAGATPSGPAPVASSTRSVSRGSIGRPPSSGPPPYARTSAPAATRSARTAPACAAATARSQIGRPGRSRTGARHRARTFRRGATPAVSVARAGGRSTRRASGDTRGSAPVVAGGREPRRSTVPRTPTPSPITAPRPASVAGSARADASACRRRAPRATRSASSSRRSSPRRTQSTTRFAQASASARRPSASHTSASAATPSVCPAAGVTAPEVHGRSRAGVPNPAPVPPGSAAESRGARSGGQIRPIRYALRIGYAAAAASACESSTAIAKRRDAPRDGFRMPAS